MNHTLKGNARSLGITLLSERVHEVEEHLKVLNESHEKDFELFLTEVRPSEFF